jgi:hypothetical protein
MKSYLTIWAYGDALIQAALAEETGRAVVEQRAQVFTIGLNGSVADETAFFGPVREAEWAPGWSPRFIHPAQALQREGQCSLRQAPMARIDSGCSQHTTLGTAGWST